MADIKQTHTMSKRGGVRPGAGRPKINDKKKEPTKSIKVPVSVIEKLKELIKLLE